MLAVAGSEVGVDRVQTVQQLGSSELGAGPRSPAVMSSGRQREQRRQEQRLACADGVRLFSLCTHRWGSGAAPGFCYFFYLMNIMKVDPETFVFWDFCRIRKRFFLLCDSHNAGQMKHSGCSASAAINKTQRGSEVSVKVVGKICHLHHPISCTVQALHIYGYLHTH